MSGPPPQPTKCDLPPHPPPRQSAELLGWWAHKVRSPTLAVASARQQPTPRTKNGHPPQTLADTGLILGCSLRVFTASFRFSCA
eukprot:1175510-Prorocentrum_minimum.AAC.4